MSEETAEYRVKAKIDVRTALEVLKHAVLQALYEQHRDGICPAIGNLDHSLNQDSDTIQSY